MQAENTHTQKLKENTKQILKPKCNVHLRKAGSVSTEELL